MLECEDSVDFILKYVGPKPLYSCKGVTFDTRKQDKFIYLMSLAELIQSVDHDYTVSNPYIAEAGQNSLDENEIVDLIRKHMQEFDQYMEQWIIKTTDEINDEIARIQCCNIHTSQEKVAIINNIQILRESLIQRSINKSVYYAGIQVLTNIFKKNHMKYIMTPMVGGFLHVLHSLQGPLRISHPPIDTSLEIFLKKNRLMVALKC